MNNLRKKLKNLSLIKSLSSIKITVTCLALLIILTLWGTIAQVDQGLYNAQERFFFSFYFLALGFIPFPGAQLVLWVLFFNLVAVAISRFVYKLSHIGILIIHIGLLTYFVSAFLTLHLSKESHVTFMEGDATNLSTSYRLWEISIWDNSEDTNRHITAVNLNTLKEGQSIALGSLPASLTLEKLYPNADAYTGQPDTAQPSYKNASGITHFVAVRDNKEPEKNIPGILVKIKDKSNIHRILLFGVESDPTNIEIDGKTYNFILRNKKYPLPFTIKLKEFKAEFHPGTDMARSYQSLVEIDHDGITRDVLIYMNNPLRYKDYTLYQASYAVDKMGRRMSTLAVVKNAGQILPYISSLLTFLGLTIHFLLMAWKSKKA